MTTHENQTDTVYIVGYWLDFFMKKIDPMLATKINHALIMRYLKRHIGKYPSFLKVQCSGSKCN